MYIQTYIYIYRCFISRVDSGCAFKLACHRAKCITCLLTHSGMAASSGWLAILAQEFLGPRDPIADYGLFLLFLLFSVVFLLLVMAAAGALASRASDAELTLEQVATMLSGITGKTVSEFGLLEWWTRFMPLSWWAC